MVLFSYLLSLKALRETNDCYFMSLLSFPCTNSSSLGFEQFVFDHFYPIIFVSASVRFGRLNQVLLFSKLLYNIISRMPKILYIEILLFKTDYVHISSFCFREQYKLHFSISLPKAHHSCPNLQSLSVMCHKDRQKDAYNLNERLITDYCSLHYDQIITV